ncbi:hypothetical protein H4F99_11705 [Lysobacter sp. SG-8]|uniref:DUF3298 domain-containing protein n=1 Tax=Marilutibacter penaei TaxID=2759900 RepID=A0A7W3YFE1_9GAMM|nr:RsiV family protein [Lysobacter penaei]MBB1089146.1 hypothetical protein [Lysobacter penaei]
MKSCSRLLILPACLLVGLVACGRDPAPSPDATPANPAGPAAGTDMGEDATAQAPSGPVELEDVSEISSAHVIGISYPDSASRYPGLARLLQQYSDDARADLAQAEAARGEGSDDTLYDLSISYVELVDTPRLYAVAADGSSYTGGAHSAPLLARWVWLPAEQSLLEITDLVPEGPAWRDIAQRVREQLHTALSQRLDADELDAGERAVMAREAGRMIDDGTGPEPDHYRQFEPVVDAAGRITAIRFVFPPYQVGPYSDGVQTVELPAEVLLPHITDEYRELFAR